MGSRRELLRAYLDSGLRAHRQGDLTTASEAYRQALAIVPDDGNALNLFGTALLQLGKPDQAVDYLKRAARKQRDNPGVLGNLAQAYFSLGRHEESQEAFRKASRLDPREVQFQLGIANSFAMQGKLGDAETLLNRLAERFADQPLVWFNHGNVMRDRQRSQEAIDSYSKALELAPHFLDARNNLGGVLHALQRFEDAEREYRACIQQAPDYPPRCNLVSLLIDVGRFAEAEALCREMIGEAPEMERAHSLLGAALGHQGRLLQALACYRAAAELAPQAAKTVRTYAAALTEAGHVNEGLRWFSRALALGVDLASVQYMLGTTLLAHGFLADGWKGYCYRSAFTRFREQHADLTLSQTLPAELAGRRVCVLREQGLGDEIFFLRYAPQLQAAGARIVYRAHNKIGSLLARVACIEQLLEETVPLPEADTVILVGDLAHALSSYPASALPGPPVAPTNFRIQDFPHCISVFWPAVPPTLALTPLDEQLLAMSRRLAEIGPPPYLGLTWRAGTPPQEQQGVSWVLYKGVGIALLAEAVRGFPGTVIALQRKPMLGELRRLSDVLGQPVHDFTDLNEDLEGMLALLALIDEYIGVSNTNMHLRAGAGNTARVLVPCPAEWRWMAAGNESPWFPGFRVYRQQPSGSWDDAFERLRHDLFTRFGAAGQNR